MKNLIYSVLLVAVVAVALNDGGRLFAGHSSLRDSTNDLSSWALNNAATLTREKAVEQLVARATELHMRVYQYGQDKSGIQIWTETSVGGLWVAGTYKAVLGGMPFRQALGQPIVIRDYASVQFR